MEKLITKSFKRLLDKGIHRGFITYEELGKSLEEEVSKRRNFAIISHPDAGKTTLTEKLLLYGGAIQAGVGLVMILVLSYSGFDLVVANSIKVMINTLVTVFALPVFIFSGKVSWGPALVLAAGLTAGGWIGAKWTVEGGERVVRWVMVIAALGLSGKLVGLYG